MILQKENNRLSEESYWDSIYEKAPTKSKHDSTSKRIIKRILGKKWSQITKDYSEYLFWNSIVEKNLPKGSHIKFLEIGSAPGQYLTNFNKKQLYNVFGIEYTQHGFDINRETFRNAGLQENNVIHGDMFSSEIQNKYKEYFDIVYSGGLIEHFSNVGDVIDKHISLLKPNGLLMITIPNLKHTNLKLTNFFNKEIIDIHNLNIMDIDTFLNLFKNKNITPVYSGYYGTFNLGLFNAASKGKRFTLKVLQFILRPPLNILLYLLFRDKGKETKYFSPYLIYIGRKRA